jgi:hypothetical protein
VGLAILAGTHSHTAILVIAHAHNLIAVGLASWIARDKVRAPWLPVLLWATGLVLFAVGAFDPLLAESWRVLAWAHQSRGQAFAMLAPPGVSPVVGMRFVGSFAFAQTVHYAAWLRVVPDAERRCERPVSYRRSFELLVSDFGRAGAAAIVVLAVALPVGALFAIAKTRTFYYMLANFHGYVELSFIAAGLLVALSARAAVGRSGIQSTVQ